MTIINPLCDKFISTNTLLAEGDEMFPFKMDNDLFQPTPSSRRVTLKSTLHITDRPYFNQHPPRGG